MIDKNDRSRTSPPQTAPVARKGLMTTRPEEARDQPLAYFLAPSQYGKGGAPFAGDDAE
jgi:hypothetical protein